MKNFEKSDRSCCQKLKFSKGLDLITSFMEENFHAYHFIRPGQTDSQRTRTDPSDQTADESKVICEPPS